MFCVHQKVKSATEVTWTCTCIHTGCVTVVHTCTCTCTLLSVHVHVHIHANVYACTDARTRTRTCRYIPTCNYAYQMAKTMQSAHSNPYPFHQNNTHVSVYVYVQRIYMYMYIHARESIYMYIQWMRMRAETNLVLTWHYCPDITSTKRSNVRVLHNSQTLLPLNCMLLVTGSPLEHMTFETPWKIRGESLVDFITWLTSMVEWTYMYLACLKA